MVENNINNEEKTNVSASDVENSSVASPGNNGSTATGDSRSETTGRSSSKNDDAARNEELARRETRHVNRLRYFVLASLFVAAVGVAALVYLISQNAVHEEMHTLFFADCLRFEEIFEDIRTERIATLASLAVTAIAHAIDHKHDWPFVTLSSYQQRAYTAKEHSGALQVSISPLVTQENRAQWEKYIISNETDVDWMDDSIVYQEEVGSQAFIKDYGKAFHGSNATQPHSIKRRDPRTGETVPVHFDAKDRYLPAWEMSPFLSYDDVNVDLLQDDDPRSFFAQLCLNQGAIVIGDLQYQSPGGMDSPNWITSTYSQLLSITAGEEMDYLGDPISHVFIPIFDSFKVNRVPTAVLVGLFNWGNFFKHVLPEGTNGIDLVLRNNCSDPFTYRVNGEDVIPLGIGDLHDRDFDHFEFNTHALEGGMIADGTKSGLGFVDRQCFYTLSIYPSQVFADDFKTATPWVMVAAVAGVMFFAIVMFIVYDYLVERRQTLVLRKAIQSSAIVSSLFPKNVGERLMKESGTSPGDEGEARTVTAFREFLRKKRGSTLPSTEKGTMAKQESVGDDDMEETIADLFPSCTVLFSDIAGFTAWSSTREPSQVFILLQNLYRAFDKIAVRRKVFKVETIGDSYLAVTGLPEPQEAHAIIMAKFARDCMQKMHEITSALEVRLGPDTCDLSMRFGLNSGQVTGGVLRGDRARFQLFGDTVNTAARMESTGERGRIQLSQSTADLLIAAGKKHWLRPREEPVTAKGKGIMYTFWLEIDGHRADLNSSDKDLLDAENKAASATLRRSKVKSLITAASVALQQESRRIDWLAEVLLDYVKQIVTQNKTSSRVEKPRGSAYRYNPGTICLDEVVESFDFPRDNNYLDHHHHHTVELHPAVTQELHTYVTEISALYHERNAFHNFDHACHVTMSVHKLLKRVVTSKSTTSSDSTTEHAGVIGPANDHSQNPNGTHIATPDPLTLLAIVFASLIHDIDHPGVSNMQLTMEQPEMAKHYRAKSVAEQSSFDIGWDLLMSESYDNLRRAIFPTEFDLKRFRQVVVNSVLATDIFDKEMSDRRKARWDRVFGGAAGVMTDPVTSNTRTTIVLEYIIQASDVSHTMQHWHVYTKWNRRLFEEMRLAFSQGRMANDPATFWYEGELGFFDNYVIPLAKKLQECRVFGVSSDECLNYALSNRNEWEAKGKEIVLDMTSSIQVEQVNK